MISSAHVVAPVQNLGKCSASSSTGAEPILLFSHLFFFPVILFFLPILLNILLII